MTGSCGDALRWRKQCQRTNSRAYRRLLLQCGNRIGRKPNGFLGICSCSGLGGCWRRTSVPAGLASGSYRWHSGKHMLVTRLSLADPHRKLGRKKSASRIWYGSGPTRSPGQAVRPFKVAEATGFAFTDVEDNLEDVLMAAERLLTACFLWLFSTPLFAGDPHPPQLNVSFLSRPAPIVQDGSTRLVYEMVITNFSNNKYALDAVEAKAGTAQFTFAGSALAGMIIPLGAWGKPEDAADRTVDGGRSLIVFLLLDLWQQQGSKHDRAYAPRT